MWGGGGGGGVGGGAYRSPLEKAYNQKRSWLKDTAKGLYKTSCEQGGMGGRAGGVASDEGSAKFSRQRPLAGRWEPPIRERSQVLSGGKEGKAWKTAVAGRPGEKGEKSLRLHP